MDTKTKDAINETVSILLGLDGLLLALMESPNMITAFELAAVRRLVNDAAHTLPKTKERGEE